VAGLMRPCWLSSMRNCQRNLHFQKLNPHIELKGSPFYVNCKLTDWAGQRSTRRARRNGAGIGGTNAHVVLEEAPPLP